MTGVADQPVDMNSPRDIYRYGIDFQKLGNTDTNIKNILDKDGNIDFKKPQNVQTLTKALLKRDFGLQMILPDDRLCPPVPVRLQYILWIEDLLNTTIPDFTTTHENITPIWGIDIGTGASCIYPLLGCALHAAWSFKATDIDDKSLDYAERNVSMNDLASRIAVHRVLSTDPILHRKYVDRHYDFTVCNPPFYASEDEMMESASAKTIPPNSACTGAPNEMICSGGEVAFVTQMVDESVLLRNDIKWFTSMVGKLSSISVIVTKLKEIGITNWAVTEFAPGKQTKRWAIAWSFGGLRPKVEVARGAANLEKKLLPFPSHQSMPLNLDMEVAKERLEVVLLSLDLEKIRDGIYVSTGDVWSRSARRKRKREDVQCESTAHASMLSFAIACDISAAEVPGHSAIEIRWLLGLDSVIFESFCGMLKRRLA